MTPGDTQNRSSTELFAEAATLIPGGVNSPVRAFGSVGGTPFMVQRGEGAYLYDVENRPYVDYVMSWGPLILGHAYPDVVKAVQTQADMGMSYGAPTQNESVLTAIVRERMPWIEKLRLVSSGTEACMTAVRIARGATGRGLVVKFDGGYHGHSDGFLVKAGSGLATGNLPASAGVPSAITELTLSLPYNDTEAVTKAFERHGSEIAAVIVEPVAANMGVVPPAAGFLQHLRSTTAKHGAVLIFDEVITGFRVAVGGAAELYRIKPDLVCLGKILGGGLPIGGVGGRAELMDHLAPVGAVYQAGTLSGNPLSTAAGIATLRALERGEAYAVIRRSAEELTDTIRRLGESCGVPLTVNRVESLFTLFFGNQPVTDFVSAQQSDMTLYAEFFHSLLDQGVYVAPSGYEAWFVSTAHGEEQIDITVGAVERFLEGRAK